MKIEHLEYFAEVAYHSSINKAAKSLLFSQPTVTKAIKSLEAELGFLLFERTYKGVILTEKGRKVYDDVKVILDLIQSWDSLNERELEIAGEVHISVIPSISTSLLSQYVSRLKKEYPQINLCIHEGRKYNLLTHLTSKQATVGLLAYLDGERDTVYRFAQNNNLVIRELFTDHFCIYLNSTHPLAHKNILTLDDLKTLPVAVYAGDDPVSPHFISYFKQEELYHMSNLTAMISLAISQNIAAVCTRAYSYQHPLVDSGVIKLVDVEGFDIPFHYCLLYPSELSITVAETIVVETLSNTFLDII